MSRDLDAMDLTRIGEKLADVFAEPLGDERWTSNFHQHRKIVGLAGGSKRADGERLVRALEGLGFRVVRGGP